MFDAHLKTCSGIHTAMTSLAEWQSPAGQESTSRTQTQWELSSHVMISSEKPFSFNSVMLTPCNWARSSCECVRNKSACRWKNQYIRQARLSSQSFLCISTNKPNIIQQGVVPLSYLQNVFQIAPRCLPIREHGLYSWSRTLCFRR